MATIRPSGHPADAPRVHHDPLAARSVFVAPGRATRPDDAALVAGGGGDPRDWCPFCAGNESRTPPASERVPVDESLPWRARVVPNRYPVAIDAVGAPAAGPGRAACGVHDVVIESAAHDRSVLAVAPEAWRDVWELVRRRLAAVASRDDVAWACVFKNSGPLAGASLEHLHSQLVGLDFVPDAVAREVAAVTAQPDAFAAMVAAARREGRIVNEAADLVALVPGAPRQPLETWILPTAAEAFFHATSDRRVAALADLTRWFVARLAALAPDADYNWWLHQLPFTGHDDLVGHWHWHLEILPRITPLAGFELATGCHISVMAPHEAARLLRDG